MEEIRVVLQALESVDDGQDDEATVQLNMGVERPGFAGMHGSRIRGGREDDMEFHEQAG